MMLYDSTGIGYCLEITNPFTSDKTFGYLEKKIDGIDHRFFFVLTELSDLFVEIDKIWYTMGFTIIDEFYTTDPTMDKGNPPNS